MRTFIRWSALLAIFVCLLAAMPLAAGVAPPTQVDLAVEKFGPPQAAADTDVSYNVTLTNAGPDDAVDVELSDPVPAGMTFVSATQNTGPAFTCMNLGGGNSSGGNGGIVIGETVSCTNALFPAGATATFTFVFHIDAGTPPGTTFVNTATATTTTFDSNDENNSAVAVTTTPPPPSADLAVTKNGPASAGENTNIVYTIGVVNAGPDTAADVSLDDTLPGTLTFVSLTQNSGPTMICTTPAVGTGGAINCTAASFGNGAAASFTLVAHVPASTPSGTSYTNTVTATSKSNDPAEENNSGTVTTIISGTDLTVDKSGPASAIGNSNISYVIIVTNNGPDAATDVQLDDALPPGTTFVSIIQDNGPPASCSSPSIGANGTVSCSFPFLGFGASAQFTLTINTGSTSSITNTAVVSGETFDPNGGNNSDSVLTTVTANADLGVSKSGPANVTAGQNASYSVTLTNGGPSAAANVSLTDAVPANTTFVSATQNSGPTFNCSTPAAGATGTITCTNASFVNGATATFTFVFRASPGTASGTIITNTANVTTSTVDPNGGNNSANANNTTVVTSADLRVAKNGPATAFAGANLTYTIDVANDGPSDAQTVTLTDNVPANTTFVSFTQTSGPAFNCAPLPPGGGTGTVTCTIASFATGGAASFTMVVQASPVSIVPIANTATIGSTTTDPNAGNNSSTANTNLSFSADVAVAKSGPAAVTAGNNISYTVTASNNGPSTAANVTLTDATPANTTFVSATQNSGPPFNCTPPAVGSTGTINCTIAALNSGATATFTFVFAVNNAAVGTVVNTATISTTTTDPTPANNTSTATAAIGAGVTDVSITKTTSTDRFPTGLPIPFTITVNNAGPSVAINTVVTDILPAGSTFVSATPSQGSCSGTTTVICNLGNLAPSGSATIALVINAPATAGPFANTATVSSTNLDSAPANNSSTVNGTVFPASEIPTLPLWALALLASGLVAVVLLKR